MRPREVFLSHADKDRRFVTKVAKTLAGNGVKVWYSRKHLVGAQQWHDEIGAALKRCDWFAVILSPHSVRSEWVKREVVYALSTKKYSRRIVPIVYRRCNFHRLSWALGGYQQVKFSRNFNEGCKNLLKIWRIKYKGLPMP